MRTPLVLVASALVALAGCFHDSGSTPGGDTKPTATITSVTFASAPTTGVGGEKVIVCWRVEGTGTIAHSAIHTDTTSRAGQGFAAYGGATFYPDNATSAVAVTLPQTSCTGVLLPSTPPAGGKLYLRAHAMIVGQSPGIVSADEKSVTVTHPGKDTATSVVFTSVPSKAATNSTVTVCWRVEGMGNVTHTALHWDTATHNTTGATFQAYPKAAYPDNKTATEAPAKFAIPQTFCTGLKMPVSGKAFVRAHVIDASGGNGKLSVREAVIDVLGLASSIAFVESSLPLTALKNENKTICWRVEGAGTVPHTAIHTDRSSHANSGDFAAYNGTAFYPDNTTAAQQTGYSLPAKFCTNVKMPNESGNFYLRAHVIDVAGTPGKLSTERSVLVTL